MIGMLKNGRDLITNDTQISMLEQDSVTKVNSLDNVGFEGVSPSPTLASHVGRVNAVGWLNAGL